MGVEALGAWNVMLGGVGLSIIADPEKPANDTPGYSGSFETQESANRLERRDVTVIIGSSYRKGMGYVRRRTDADDGGYSHGENMMMWWEDGARPAGRRKSYSLSGLSDGGAALSGSRFWQSAEFDGHLFIAAYDGVVIRIPNVDPTQTPVYDPALNAFGAATKSVRTNYKCFQLIPFEYPTGHVVGGAPVSALYLGAADPAASSRMYERAIGGGWSESAAFASVRLERFATLWWQDEEGVGADRLIVRSNTNNEIRQLIKGENPLAEASYTTPIKVGTPNSEIQVLVAAPQRVFVHKTDGLYDITPFRAPNLTPYVAANLSLNTHTATLIGRVPAILYGDDIVFANGMSVGRYDTTLEGKQSRLAIDISPWAFAQDGFPIVGWPTAFAIHDGWLLMAVWNPNNLTSYIVRGRPRGNLDIANDYVWHGAEVVIPPAAGVGRLITWMHVGAVSNTSGTTLASIKTHLFMGCLNSNAGAPSIEYVQLPDGGGPLSLALSGGTFEYNPTATLYHTGQNWGDGNALKPVRRYDHAGARVSASNFITLAMRADGDPTTTTGYTDEGTIVANSQKVVPATVKSGRFIQTRETWTVASPYTTAPVSYELRARAAVRRETFDVRFLHVILEREYELLDGTPDLRDMDSVLASIVAFQDTAQQTFVDELGRTYQALVEQGITYTRTNIGDGEYRTVATVEISLVSGPA